MRTLSCSVFLLAAGLSACASTATKRLSAIDKQTRYACEQQASIAQARYLARIKTPMYTSSISRTWAGGARSDTGQWLYENTLQSCMLQAQHAAHP